MDFYTGVSNPDILSELFKEGVQVKTPYGLHAKIYNCDDKWSVVTGANFTGGGLTNDHEWGLLVTREECPDVFKQATALWGRSSGLVTQNAIDSVKVDSPHIAPRAN